MLSTIIFLLYIVFVAFYSYLTLKNNKDDEIEHNIGTLLIVILFNLFIIPYVVISLISKIKIE